MHFVFTLFGVSCRDNLWEIFGGCWVKTSEISPVHLLENPDKKLKLRNDVLLSCAGNRWRHMLSGKLERLFKEAIRRIGTDVDGEKVDKCDSMFQPLCFSFGVSYFWTFSTLNLPWVRCSCTHRILSLDQRQKKPNAPEDGTGRCGDWAKWILGSSSSLWRVTSSLREGKIKISVF